MDTDLAGFLRARLDEDDALARACAGDSHWTDDAIAVLAPQLAIEPRLHIARHDPARVMDDVAAKRRMLDSHYSHRGVCPTCFDQRNRPMLRERWPCETARLIALPYADHPDYQEEWRPK
ncbi:DUF6221 family protein [Spirillospora albida]|uniref:DUF6221 family protein n=1 Tax=Spirillospora albida TaxID=58123 RepID=UPI00055FD561|nr:DUF6221 family protein [Spirillospora albida]